MSAMQLCSRNSDRNIFALMDIQRITFRAARRNACAMRDLKFPPRSR